MSVRKIRDSWWVDFRVEGVRYRKRSPDNSRAGAAAYEALLRGRLARGESLDPQLETATASPRFDEFARGWLDTYAKLDHKPSYYEGSCRRVHVVLAPWFGTRRLDEIGTIDVDRFKAAQTARGLAPATVNSFLVTLRKILQTAVDWGR
ncbi:MAG: hypothetical protein Q8S13_13175, partial [Dehalococcoidia bacterium]|nr:hypothetical protein [Dehalococcoidia bacterium]